MDSNAMEEVEPTCDICGLEQVCGDESCTICPSNWDGERGEHISCQEFVAWKAANPNA